MSYPILHNIYKCLADAPQEIIKILYLILHNYKNVYTILHNKYSYLILHNVNSNFFDLTYSI